MASNHSTTGKPDLCLTWKSDFCVKILKKIRYKIFHRKIFSANFMNFIYLTLCPNLPEKTHFYFQYSPDSMILHILKNISISKDPFAL